MSSIMKLISIQSVVKVLSSSILCWMYGIVLCVMVFQLQSCTDNNVITRPQDVVFPDSSISYLRSVQPFTQITCAFSGCHGDGSRIVMTNYFTMIGNPGLLIPNKPDISTYVQVLEGKLSHNNAFYSLINDNHKRGIRRWVLEGARNN
jgi:hypothetical protein